MSCKMVPVLVIWSFILSTAMAGAVLSKPAVVYTSQHSALVTWLDTDRIEDGEYIVEYGTDWQHSKTLKVSRKSNTAMIHNLRPDTLYAVRVNAQKAHLGPYIRFRTRPYAVSFAAPAVAVQPKPHNRLLVTWDLPPGMHASDVVHFSLMYCPLYSPYFKKTSLVLPGNYRLFVLKYLRPETVYKVKLAALLKTKKGPYSSWVMEKTVGSIGATHLTTQNTQRITQPTTYNQPTNLPRTTQTTTQQQTTTEEQQATKQEQATKEQQATTEEQTTKGLLTTTQEQEEQATKEQPRQQLTLSSTQQNTYRPTTQTNQNKRRTSIAPATNSEQVVNPTTNHKAAQTKAIAAPKGLAPTRSVLVTEPEEIGEQKLSPQPPLTSLVVTRKAISSSTMLVISGPLPTVAEASTCERIQPSEICSDNGYRTTKILFKESQKVMMQHVESTWLMLSSVCKSRAYLKRFICAVNFPYCSVTLGGPFLPCRSMCTVTKDSCGLDNDDVWPAELNCANFPKVGENKICIAYGHNGAAPTTAEMPTTTAKPPSTNPMAHPGQHVTSPGNVGTDPSSMASSIEDVVIEIPTMDSTATKYIVTTTKADPGQPITSPGNVGTEPTSMASSIEDVVTEIPTMDSTAANDIVTATKADPGQSITSPGNVGTEPTNGMTLNTDDAVTQIPITNSPIPNTIVTTTKAGQSITSPGNVGTEPTNGMTLNTDDTVTQIPTSEWTTSYAMISTRATTTSQANEESNIHNGGKGDSTVVTAPSFPPEGCEPISLRICQGAGYSITQFPNFFNHTHQNDAARAIMHYWPLVEARCSSKFQLFLCSLYTPLCTKTLLRGRGIVPGNILPCRSVCRQVSRECGTLMRVYEYTWPDGVDCQKFPEDGKETCLYGNTDVTDNTGLVKFADTKQEKIQANEKPGIKGCQELPLAHVCKKHYMVGALSNTSKSFGSVDTAIRNRIALVRDSASKKCVRNLELFMCSLYVPHCLNDYQPHGPCRSQCKTTLRRCNGALKALNIFIPELNNCRKFPLIGCTRNKRKLGKKRQLVIQSH